MGAYDRSTARNVNDAVLGTAAFVATVTPVRCRLMTANGSETTAGTELATGGGYTAGTGAPSLTFTATDAAGRAGSSSAVTVTMPAATIVGVEVWDSAATPKRKAWGALASSKTFGAGDILSIPADQLAVNLP